MSRLRTAEAERDRYRAALQDIARGDCEELIGTPGRGRCPEIWCEGREGWCGPCLAAAALEGE